MGTPEREENIMDLNALFNRDKAYYEAINDKLCVYLPEFNQNLVASAKVAIISDNVATTITAPFKPNSDVIVSQLQVLEKKVSDPYSYETTWVSLDSATLSPSPLSVSPGDLFRIDSSTYEVSAIDGDKVTFTTPVSELSVFYASVATPNVSYQWQNSIDEGENWVDIDGATDRSYEAVTEDVGDLLRVIISYEDDQGTIEKPTLAPPESQPSTIYPAYPIIADLTFDIRRTYKANTLVDFTITILSE